MTGGFLDRRPVQPLSLGLIIGAHVLVLLALATAVQTIGKAPGPITYFHDWTAPPPPPQPAHEKVTPQKPHTRPDQALTHPDPIVKTDGSNAAQTALTDTKPIEVTPTADDGAKTDGGPITPAQTPPVLVGAAVDSRYSGDLQPPYPAALQRAGTEGSVTVRVRIGTDGRVLEVRQVSATDPLFFAATEKQALKRWRFRPATRGGMPEESWLVETVRFRLDEL